MKRITINDDDNKSTIEFKNNEKKEHAKECGMTAMSKDDRGVQ